MLNDFILKHVSPLSYYKAAFQGTKLRSAGETDVFCPFHNDDRPGGSPSMSVNTKTGAFYCHRCEEGGNTIVEFEARYEGITPKRALKALFHRFIHPVIPPSKVKHFKQQLSKTPTIEQYLLKTRMLTENILKAFEIGFDGRRITIPIYNEFNLLINIRMYDPTAKKNTRRKKMVNYTLDDEPRSFGTPSMLFPMQIMLGAKDDIIIAEGEWDALLLNRIGLDTVTTTGGAKGWPSQYNRMFANKDVTIVYDNDESGREGTKIIIDNIGGIARSIHILKVPKKYGKDVTDWVSSNKSMRSIGRWKRLIKSKSASLAKTTSTSVVQRVPLEKATASKWLNKLISVDAIITGKDIAPYLVPKKIRLSCNKSEPCTGCPLAQHGTTSIEHTIDVKNPSVLKLINVTDYGLRKELLALLGIKRKCFGEIEIIDTVNIEQLILSPTLDSSNTAYVTRSAFYIGHGIPMNRSYRFEGITTPDPRDQHATHLFFNASSVQGQIESFKMTKRLASDLKVFTPGQSNIMSKLMSIADWQSQHITKIRERPDMHIAVDLVFHSVPSFIFNDELVNRGMLDLLILGDTRCGKGYVTERLVKYYNLGEVASGENCSFAGLVGGLQQISRRWFVTWGVIPLNNMRLVVIDEASALSEAEIGHMSRIRSEGVAEISKIIKEKTSANTRLIWLSNCRSGKPITAYNTGIEAIKELMGSNEDISRFDFALTVASNEVPSEIINVTEEYNSSDSNRYSNELCRNLILWAWSRNLDQIKFTKHAIERIMQQSILFGSTYSSAIPLVQAEDIRIKLAKLSAATAARVFSSDATGEIVVVKRIHVDFACSFLKMLYAKPSMSYDIFSRSTMASMKIGSSSRIRTIMKRLGTDEAMTIAGLLELHNITPDNLADFVGDNIEAKALIGELVRLKCLFRDESKYGYIKNPSFTGWLRKEQKNGSSKKHERVPRKSK